MRTPVTWLENEREILSIEIELWRDVERREDVRQDRTLCWNLEFGDNAKLGQVARRVKEIKEQISAPQIFCFTQYDGSRGLVTSITEEMVGGYTEDAVGRWKRLCGPSSSSARMYSQIRRRMHPVLQLSVLGARVDVDHRRLHKRVPELLLDGQEMRSAMEQIGRQ